MGRRSGAFFAALALHALAAALLGLVPPSATVTPPLSRAIEIEWTRPVHIPQPTLPAADELMQRRDEVASRPPVTRHRTAALTRQTVPTMSPPSTVLEPTLAAPVAGPRGQAELFPHGLLEGLAAPPPDDEPGRDRDRETPGGWLDDSAATARTRAGQVDPVWREVERELVQSFHPPLDVVHEAAAGKVARALDRLDTYLKQQAAVIEGGEERLRHPIDPDSHGLRFSADAPIAASQQGFTGAPEGLNLRSLPLSQQEAVMAATGDPASWLEVELEITVDGAGNVTHTRVVMPSGRRAFDRYALRLVAERVAHATAPASISRWVCRAGYAASRPDAIGVHFDLSMLFEKRRPEQVSVQYPWKERVETRVSLKWVKTAP